MELVTFRFPTTIRFGAGARAALQELAGVKRPLLVTDEGLVNTEAYALVAKEMDRVWPGGTWTAFSGVHPNPLESDAEAALAAYNAGSCDAVIGLGGGSALDGAKALLLKIAFPDTPLNDIPLDQLPELIVPLCAIPTTAGTGSEVGRSTVITIQSIGRKAVFGGPALMPSLALLDPELTVGLPPQLTAATGMDAMTHAIEAFVCPVFHPICDGIALEAIYRVRRYLPRAVADGTDLQARGEMLVAAAMGAISFQKDLGAAHSLAHPLSTEFGLNHGLATAVVLPAVVRFNGEQDSGLYERVATALGLPASDDPTTAVAGCLAQMARELGVGQKLRELDVPQDALPMLATKAFADGCHLTNPRQCSEADLLQLYKQSW